jgi:AcrR family transcriptional regulator
VAPSPPAPAPTPRRTQAERRASTRSALLQATIDCLIELGYAGTTTNEVQQRAGVSRGALTHHFAAKADLLIAAMDSLYDDFSASIREVVPTLPAGQARIRPAIRLLWDRFNGPLFFAAMELWSAARTDPELRAALLPHERRLGRQLRSLAVEVFGAELAAHPAADSVYQVLMTSMRGQAMSYALRPGASREGPHLQHWFDLVDAFA